MNHRFPRPPKDLPAGFFRFTRWSDNPAETFPAWRTHFAARGIRVILIHSEAHVALFREGIEAVSYGSSRRRCQGPVLRKIEADAILK